jgi:hypothetical protein
MDSKLETKAVHLNNFRGTLVVLKLISKSWKYELPVEPLPNRGCICINAGYRSNDRPANPTIFAIAHSLDPIKIRSISIRGDSLCAAL